MKFIIPLLLTLSLLPHHDLLAQAYDVKSISVTPYAKPFKRVGKVAFKRTSKLSFKNSGYLSKLSVDEGDFFTKSQLLASLNTVSLKAEKNSRYAQLLKAKRDVTRIKSLLEKELGSQQALDEAQTLVETMRAAYKIAYYNLEKSEITAPFNGVVLARKAELNEYQSPGIAALEVAQVDNNLIVKIGLTGVEVGHVTVGQRVKVHLAKLGAIDGVISKIPVMASNQNQLYLVEVLLSSVKAGDGVFSGQLAHVVIDFSTDDFVYQIPISALNGINDNGEALIVLEPQKSQFILEAFDVFTVDSQYVYTRAKNTDDEINVVTNGWQHLLFSEQ